VHKVSMETEEKAPVKKRINNVLLEKKYVENLFDLYNTPNAMKAKQKSIIFKKEEQENATKDRVVAVVAVNEKLKQEKSTNDTSILAHNKTDMLIHASDIHNASIRNEQSIFNINDSTMLLPGTEEKIKKRKTSFEASKITEHSTFYIDRKDKIISKTIEAKQQITSFFGGKPPRSRPAMKVRSSKVKHLPKLVVLNPINEQNTTITLNPYNPINKFSAPGGTRKSSTKAGSLERLSFSPLPVHFDDKLSPMQIPLHRRSEVSPLQPRDRKYYQGTQSSMMKVIVKPRAESNRRYPKVANCVL